MACNCPSCIGKDKIQVVNKDSNQLKPESYLVPQLLRFKDTHGPKNTFHNVSIPGHKSQQGGNISLATA